ncbi:TonB-dependent receptor [Gallaecimonas pentaromativorans]|uniref:Iron complex outermembrane receptor protein n=1 Tax=Gallaecimonas pentaromativorans TaxID=584787 RepID=A0A3N1PVB9_9GAMM|nr:TonB-dependent receptor [Gallaecimonas pentaromativorans]ROQ30700.1 iron complex outermembrane receptor protein [Gallaecimonas pentaromativorans]
METRKLSSCALAVRVALVLGGALSLPALAADPAQQPAAKATASKDTSDIERIEVTGIRASMKASVNTKRFSNSVVDAITSEDIGKFPDKNVAESLSRITGVSVTRDFGEGEKIAVRGTDPSQNRTLLNGSAVASADWFVLDNPSRAFNFTLLPSNLISSLEVYKSPQADIQEGSLGGTVYLKTFKPMQLDANTLKLSAEEQYSDNSEKWDPQLSGLYSWKNDDETFGFLISLTRQDRTLVREGQEALGFVHDDNGTEEDQSDDFWRPRVLGDAYFNQKRERKTGFAAIQWRPAERWDLNLNILNTKLDANNTNHNLYTFLDKNFNQADAQFSGNHVVAGSADNAISQLYVIDRISYSKSKAYDFEGSYDADVFKVTMKAGFTEAEGGTSRDRHYQFSRVMDHVTFDGLNHTDYVDASNTESRDQLLARPFDWMQEGARTMKDEERYGGFDFELPVSHGIFTDIKAGVYYRDHDKSQRQTGTRFHWYKDDQLNGAWPDVLPGQTNWASGVLGQYSLSDFIGGDSTANYPLLDTGKAAAIAYPAAAFASPTATFLFLADTWKVNEKIYSAYTKGNFQGEGFRGDVGVRFVKTEVRSSGYLWDGDSTAAAISLLDGYSLLADAVDPSADGDWNVRQATAKHSYDDILPNLNLVFDLTDDTLLRFSAARVMSRPDYVDIAYHESLNIPTRSGQRGNPNLDPTRANQYDIAYEWYFSDTGMLSGTFFYKDIEGLVKYEDIQTEAYDEKVGKNVVVNVTKPINGAGSEVKGVELSYQQEFGNFGILANYTYTDANAKEERDPVTSPGSGLTLGTSKHMANLTGYYENDWLSARLAYNYRTHYYDGISEYGSEVFTDNYGQLDGRIGIKVMENLELTAEAVNITDEDIEQYHIDKSAPSKKYSNGRRFYVGLNYSF